MHECRRRCPQSKQQYREACNPSCLLPLQIKTQASGQRSCQQQGGQGAEAEGQHQGGGGEAIALQEGQGEG